MQQAVEAIIMAAGKGTRLKSDTPKVLHPLMGKPLLLHVLDTLARLNTKQAQVIVGHGRDAVTECLNQQSYPFKLQTVVQEPQLGTGHAVMQVKNQAQLSGMVLILSGDVPMLRAETLEHLLSDHQSGQNDLTLLVADLENPTGYGRVLQTGQQVTGVVEEKDATPQQRAVRTVNTGIYCLNWEKVAPLLDQLSSDNAQGEFYLTDVVGLAVQAGFKVGTSILDDSQEVLGINSRADLAFCHDVLNRRTQQRLMADGVTILQPSSTLIGPEVRVGPDTIVYPGCVLMGSIDIGSHCQIGPHTTMAGEVSIADHVRVIHSMVRDSVIGSHSNIGPFAQLRDGVEISHHVNIGNFVEVKKTRIDHHTNAAHLSYLGDATLGSDVNIGAGTITANYDPIRDLKDQTTIEDGAKVGCNSVLVAPVTVGERACVAAGSVITKSVAPWDLAIARAKQTEIAQWVRKIHQQMQGIAAK